MAGPQTPGQLDCGSSEDSAPSGHRRHFASDQGPFPAKWEQGAQ